MDAIDTAAPGNLTVAQIRQADLALAEEVEKLVRRGAILNGKGISHYYPVDGKAVATPLHVAAARHLPETVQSLLVLGAEVNATDHVGRTPLMWAAQAGNPRVVQLLIEAGAELDRSDRWGFTAFDRACDFGVVSQAGRFLERAGAKHSPREKARCSVHDFAPEAPLPH